MIYGGFIRCVSYRESGFIRCVSYRESGFNRRPGQGSVFRTYVYVDDIGGFIRCVSYVIYSIQHREGGFK
jgi:hypothetical protein